MLKRIGLKEFIMHDYYQMIDAMMQQQIWCCMGWIVLWVRSKMDFKPDDTHDTLKCKILEWVILGWLDLVTTTHRGLKVGGPWHGHWRWGCDRWEHFLISQQFRWGNGELWNFTHLILLPRNCILIVPIGINYTANFEARIVFLNTI